MTKFLCAAFAAAVLCACSKSPANQQQPVQIKVQTKSQTMGVMEDGGEVTGPGLTMSWDEIQITALVDKVEITNINVNHGNCDATRNVKLPTSLAYGQRLDVSMHGCNVIAVGVDTDQGSWEANFQ